jgi:glycosyltransferase involved in cell wall biosynthesis
VTGYVDDLDASLLECSVMLLPSVLGGGVLTKVSRCMALGMPVVTNALGAAGFSDPPAPITKTKTPDEMADVTVALLRDQSAASKLGLRSRDYIHDEFSWNGSLSTYIKEFTTAMKIRAAKP